PNWPQFKAKRCLGNPGRFNHLFETVSSRSGGSIKAPLIQPTHDIGIGVIYRDLLNFWLFLIEKAGI
ncbi:hypothetical protein, partial [Pseudomonas azotoformans]